MPIPCDMCSNTPGKYYYGEGITGECCFCDGKAEHNLNLSMYLIQPAIPVLWDIKPNMPRLRWRTSYGSKARVESLVGLYISNEQFIQAALELAIPHVQGDPNYTFAISPKFPFEWMMLTGRLTQRPFGARKKEWEAYLAAYQWWDEMKSNLECMIDEQQDLNRECEMNLDHPIMKLTTKEEKVRYALRA